MAQSSENPPTTVLCRPPQKYADGRDAEFVEVELLPKEKFGSAKAIWDIISSASALEWRAYEVAWAAGYRVLRELADNPDCLSSVNARKPLGMIVAVANDLDNSIRDASVFTRAHLASKCPNCCHVVILPNSEFQSGLVPKYQSADSVPLRCKCGTSFESVGSGRFVHLQYLGSVLEQVLP